ncbi:HNH endonuclease [Ornithinimicrobium pratense]|uniref:HNH endonuclease n=1 Tax=Ornithinimicrobium pratense TaxID=2593973 RepID=A0A5J6V8G7_9MICO|nr:HNH endonuclease [Ornithinimicrobium pratense]QFG69426.1 HNH endonuclease [Ornithinimicrobium pratense]
MDTPQSTAQPGQPEGCSALEQWLVDYAQLGDLGVLTASGLAALAERRARFGLRVATPAPAWVRIQVELEAPATDADADAVAGTEAVVGAHESVVAVDAAARARSVVEADLLQAAAEVLGECRARVLDRRGLTGVTLSPATRRSVDAAVRDVAVMELELATGTSTAEAQTLLAVATTGGELRSMLLGALRRGQTRWVQVKTFWERTHAARLTSDQRLLVAYALFGTDPALACTERFDPDGELDTDTVWAHHPYQAALAREITACTGQDPDADASRRRRAYANRRVQVRLHDDGTATLTLTGPAVTIAGIRHRLDTAARALRAAGEDRTLSQLRFDLAAALHLHGTLNLPNIDVDAVDEVLDEVLTPERLAELIAVVHAQPKIHAQIIIPVDALKTGLPLCPACAQHIHPTTSHPNTGTGTGTGTDDTSGASTDGEGYTSSTDCTDGTDLLHDLQPDDANPVTPWGQAGRASSSPPPWATPPDDGPPPENQQAGQEPPDEAAPAPAPDREPLPGREPLPARGSSDSPLLGREPPGRGLVGELIGSHPMFLTPGHARELVLLPGTTLHRLLTDPADGRLIERTITTYRPDTDLRRQVLAADLYSRAPGSRLTGQALQIDHVTPYATPGGTTTETNLAALDKRTHHQKTLGHWKITIGTRRDLTFTTLLNQHRSTRVHDYNQYLHTTHPEDLDQRRDLASHAVYAHETQHQRHLHRAGDRTALRDEAWVQLTHTHPDTGHTRTGPHPETPTVDDLLNIPTQDTPNDQEQ